MNDVIDNATQERLRRAIESAPPRPYHHALITAADEVISNCTFRFILSKGGWHRMGGVLSAEGNQLSSDLEEWAIGELAKCDNDFEELMSRYADAGLMTTRHSGRTHYFVATYGSAPEDFYQLEVEELQELWDRPLFDPVQPPQDFTSLVEPIAPTRVDAHPVGSPRYRFARLVDARELLARQETTNGLVSPLARFVSEWSQSRAAEHDRFCDHWLIANLERYQSNASSSFRPGLLSVHARTLAPFQWDCNKAGVELGKQVQDFDRAAGYPGAWYFHLVASKLVPAGLPRELQRDLDNGYEYLAIKDLRLLEKLVAEPYRIDAVS